MKALLSIILLLTTTWCYSQSQLELLQQLNGTWVPDPSAVEKGQEGMMPPNMQVSCEIASQSNGVYCVVSADINGQNTVLSTELLAYNQGDDKIYLMLFNGPQVVFGSGRFEGNTFRYTDEDTEGNKIQDGSLTFEDGLLIQEVTMEAGGTEQTMRMVFMKK